MSEVILEKIGTFIDPCGGIQSAKLGFRKKKRMEEVKQTQGKISNNSIISN